MQRRRTLESQTSDRHTACEIMYDVRQTRARRRRRAPTISERISTMTRPKRVRDGEDSDGGGDSEGFSELAIGEKGTFFRT